MTMSKCAYETLSKTEKKSAKYLGSKTYTHTSTDRYAAVLDRTARLPRSTKTGMRLYGTEKRSFPKWEQHCMFGSDAIANWLNSIGFTRQNTFISGKFSREAFKRRQELEGQYWDVWTKRCPLFHKSAVAALGGWPNLWPSGDPRSLRNARLLCWTLRDAEPWLEVWQTKRDRFKVMSRITC